ncbi:hypothetical protein ACF08E_12280 [Streptomyces globisporus]|uniref:hypothetical protein n=1 Tax=Streptomyces globisporus TaxID=1908 RepID=UPI0036F786FD
MATKKYTVTLPEEPAEEILAEVGPGGLSVYVTRVVERRREQDRLGELVAWMQKEYGPLQPFLNLSVPLDRLREPFAVEDQRTAHAAAPASGGLLVSLARLSATAPGSP